MPTITLAQHTRDTIDLRVAWLNNPRVARSVYGAEGERRTTREEQVTWFDRYEHDETRRLFTILLDDHPIGITGLTDIDAGTAEAFILIGEDDAIGHGYGRQALVLLDDVARAVGVSTIRATTLRTNIAMIACNRAAGYVDVPTQNDPSEICMEKRVLKEADGE